MYSGASSITAAEMPALIDMALSQGRLADALDIADAAVHLQPGRLPALIKKAQLLVSAHKLRDADEVLDEAANVSPGDFGVQIARANVACLLGEYERAQGYIQANLAEEFAHPASLVAMVDNACRQQVPGEDCRIQMQDAYARLIDARDSNAARCSEYEQALGDIAFRMRHWALAREHWAAAGLSPDMENRRSILIAESFMFELRYTEARSILEMLIQGGEAVVPAMQLLAELALAEGNVEDSLALRAALFERDGLHRVSVGVRLAQDLLLLDEHKQADAVASQCIAFPHERLEIAYARFLLNLEKPDAAWDYVSNWLSDIDQSPQVRQVVSEIAMLASQPSAQELYTKLRNTQGGQKPQPTRQRAHIRSIFSSVEPAFADVRAARQNLGYAWARRREKGTQFREWAEASYKAATSNHLLAPVPQITAKEADQLTENGDFDILRPYVEAGSAMLFACSHQGPYMQHVLSQYCPKLRFATLGLTHDDHGMPDARNFPLRHGRERAAIGLVKALKQGESVILPVDNNSLSFVRGRNVAAATGKLFGVDIRLPDTIPRLARAFAVPSFWIYSYWCGETLRFDIRRLPDHAEGESNADWHNRWAHAYLILLEAATSAAPENINITAPLWRYLLLNQNRAQA